MGQVRTWHADAKDIFNCEQGKKFKGRLLTLEDVYHSIDNQALKNNRRLKSVKLADSVKEIETRAFIIVRLYVISIWKMSVKFAGSLF